MQQCKAPVQPLYSKRRTGLKPQLPPRPSPLALSRTTSAPPKPSPLVLSRTTSAPPKQQTISVQRRPRREAQGNAKKHQLRAQSVLFPSMFSIPSAGLSQTLRHQSASTRTDLDADPRSEFEVKGNAKNSHLGTPIASASPRQRLRPSSSMTDLNFRGKETLSVRDNYKFQPGAGVDWTTNDHLRARAMHGHSGWSNCTMESKSPRRPPRPPPVLHRPNSGTAQPTTKPTSRSPKAKSKPARPPPPRPLYKPRRPPMPLPQSEGPSDHSFELEQPDSSDLTYCYVYTSVQGNLKCEVPRPESRTHSGKSTARDGFQDDFDHYETLDMHIYSELHATSREEEHEYSQADALRYTPLTRSTMNQEHEYTQALSTRRHAPLSRSTMKQEHDYTQALRYTPLTRSTMKQEHNYTQALSTRRCTRTMKQGFKYHNVPTFEFSASQ